MPRLLPLWFVNLLRMQKGGKQEEKEQGRGRKEEEKEQGRGRKDEEGGKRREEGGGQQATLTSYIQFCHQFEAKAKRKNPETEFLTNFLTDSRKMYLLQLSRQIS